VKRLAFLACAAGFLLSAHAGEEVGAGRTAPAMEYAFGKPALLADQLTWGLAHGARLLALACARGGHGAAAEAWVAWYERERATVQAIGRRLGSHYFAAEDAPPDAIAAALGLKSDLALPPEALGPACATLAEALAQPRYDLAKRREEMLKHETEKTRPQQ
jgi:hypothetical protein